jgi:hypothetical protein
LLLPLASHRKYFAGRSESSLLSLSDSSDRELSLLALFFFFCFLWDYFLFFRLGIHHFLSDVVDRLLKIAHREALAIGEADAPYSPSWHTWHAW